MSVRMAVTTLLLACLLLAGCPRGGGGGLPGGAPRKFAGQTLAILSGSENKELEPLIARFNQANGCAVKLEYKGSVDIMLALEQGAGLPQDAVWPANSLWITLGDRQKVVKHAQSIFRSPVVMGVKPDIAQQLGWVGKDVRVADILAAAERGDLRFSMTSATQSNSGASAYLGYLYAFAGSPDVLTLEDLEKPELRLQIKRILGAVDRSSGSSGWLKDLFLKQYDSFDAMVNYESLVIEANQALLRQGRPPLRVIYPVDGLAISDSPLGLIAKGDAQKEALFLALQEYLLSAPVQQELLGLGRRAGDIGMNPQAADTAVFNPDWGIDLARTIQPIRLPDEAVIRKALELYQVAFRKPSFTIFALDYSGSMEGEGAAGMKRAMRTLLDEKLAARYFLQPTGEDVTVVIPFNHGVIDTWVVEGNDPARLRALQKQIDDLQPDGNTNIYDPVLAGLEVYQRIGSKERSFPAVILLTDGQSNTSSFAELQRGWQRLGLKKQVPVFAITFGEADESQLKELAEYSSGRIFDGSKDLTEAFRSAKGFN